MLSRLEFRWDHASSTQGFVNDPYGGSGTTGSQSLPGKDNSFILLANFVYKF